VHWQHLNGKRVDTHDSNPVQPAGRHIGPVRDLAARMNSGSLIFIRAGKSEVTVGGLR
jgi:hypothetical protein